MNKLWLVILTAILLVPNCGRQPSPEPEFNLDHFKAYNVTNIEGKYPKEVSLQDQFIGKKEAEKLTPDKIKYFLLPASKKSDKGEYPRLNEQNHLGWYPLDREILEEKFEFSNQFTNFEFTEMVVKDLKALLVPTEKIKTGSECPENLDHYLCYQRWKGERTRNQVTLGDQFQEEVTTTAIGPEYFCNPCSKDGKEIINAEDHLAVYILGEGKSAEESIDIHNQFGDQSFDVKKHVFLLVPSKKKPSSSDK